VIGAIDLDDISDHLGRHPPPLLAETPALAIHAGS
jgi:hypothetical protein